MASSAHCSVSRTWRRLSLCLACLSFFNFLFACPSFPSSAFLFFWTSKISAFDCDRVAVPCCISLSSSLLPWVHLCRCLLHSWQYGRGPGFRPLFFGASTWRSGSIRCNVPYWMCLVGLHRIIAIYYLDMDNTKQRRTSGAFRNLRYASKFPKDSFMCLKPLKRDTTFST